MTGPRWRRPTGGRTPGGREGPAARTAPEVRGGTITAISAQVNDPERVSVSIDGTFAFGIGGDDAFLQGLRVGVELTEARVAELIALDQVGKATTSGLNLLARRPRSERELRDRLKQKGFTPEAVDAAIGKLEGWNYLDDADFARYWVENREAHRPRGRRLLAQELAQKGVGRETVREVLDAAEIDEAEAAVRLARDKARSYANLPPEVAKRRLAGFLSRRGYGYDVIKPALDTVFAADDADEAAADDVDRFDPEP